MLSKRTKLVGFLGSLFIGAALLAACGSQAGTAAVPEPALAPLHAMPMDVQQATEAVQIAYRFAVANPALLSEIPCYCGCGALGHTSNYDCYVDSVDAAGLVTFDPHALACTVCVDITQDSLRLFGQGQGVAEVRRHVDRTYARYGPSNMP